MTGQHPHDRPAPERTAPGPRRAFAPSCFAPGPRAVPFVLLALGSLFLGALSGCSFSGGGASTPLLDEASTGSPLSASPIDLAAYRALMLERQDWREEISGAQGTVSATGSADALGCVPAKLTIHDFTGLRIEERRLCPPVTAAPAMPPREFTSAPSPPARHDPFYWKPRGPSLISSSDRTRPR